eukprot:1154337-Pelagomonas_calceolata.AAC.2
MYGHSLLAYGTGQPYTYLFKAHESMRRAQFPSSAHSSCNTLPHIPLTGSRGHASRQVQVPRSPEDHHQQQVGIHRLPPRRLPEVPRGGPPAERWCARHPHLQPVSVGIDHSSHWTGVALQAVT